jgi:hypothetical protein
VHRGFDDFLKELKTYRADLESTTTTPKSSTTERPAKIERSKTEYKTEFKPTSSRSVTIDSVSSGSRELGKYDYSGRLGGSIDRDSLGSRPPSRTSERPTFERSTTEYKFTSSRDLESPSRFSSSSRTSTPTYDLDTTTTPSRYKPDSSSSSYDYKEKKVVFFSSSRNNYSPK